MTCQHEIGNGTNQTLSPPDFGLQRGISHPKSIPRFDLKQTVAFSRVLLAAAEALLPFSRTTSRRVCEGPALYRLFSAFIMKPSFLVSTIRSQEYRIGRTDDLSRSRSPGIVHN